jgi:hypothetical protein
VGSCGFFVTQRVSNYRRVGVGGKEEIYVKKLVHKGILE